MSAAAADDPAASAPRRPSAGRRLRRVCISTAVLLLLGVLTTVAVAWGCAAWMQPPPLPRTGAGVALLPGGGSMPDGWWRVDVVIRPGHQLVMSRWSDPGAELVGPFLPAGNPWSLIPDWAGDDFSPTEGQDPPRFHHRSANAWGWPMPALWYRGASDETYVNAPVDGIPLPPAQSGRFLTPRSLPLRPLWMHLAIDTLFYSAAWGLLCLFGLRSLRRRESSSEPRTSASAVPPPAPDTPDAMAPAHPLHLRRCPRCGYDLLGAIALWHDRCELHGACTECGLRFEWAELLSPRVRTPDWCVEYGRGRRVLVRALATFVMAWLPWWFWRSLRMTHPIRWRRLLGYVAAILIGTWFCFLVAHGTIVWRSLQPSTTAAVLEYTLLPWRSDQVSSDYYTYPYVAPRELFLRHWRSMVWIAPWPLLFLALCPFTFLLLPISLRRARVRRGHLARIGLYALPLLAAPAMLLMIAWGAEDAAAAAGWPVLTAASDLAALLGRGAAALLLVLPFLWWSFASSRYLRLQHAWAVGVSMTLIAMLLTLLMALTITGAGIDPPWWPRTVR